MRKKKSPSHGWKLRLILRKLNSIHTSFLLCSPTTTIACRWRIRDFLKSDLVQRPCSNTEKDISVEVMESKNCRSFWRQYFPLITGLNNYVQRITTTPARWSRGHAHEGRQDFVCQAAWVAWRG